MAMLSRKEEMPNRKPSRNRLTVRELLTLPLWKEARLVAGERGLNREVTGVQVWAPAEPMSRGRPGEVLLAPAGPQREEAERLLPELEKRGAAALGIRLKRPADVVPKRLLEEAERLGLPVLTLPPDTAISAAVREALDGILEREAASLVDLQNRVRRMSRLLLEGGGLYGLLDAMEETFGNPVAIVREHDKPWLSAGLRSTEPTDVWPLVQSLTYRQVSKGAANGYLTLPYAQRAYACPVPASKGKPAYLVLLERQQELTPLDALTAGRLAPLAGLELSNAEAVREVEGKYMDQFLGDWLSGKLVREDDWRQRAEVCGCAVPDDTPLCAILVGWTNRAPSPDRLRELARRLRAEQLRSIEGLLVAPLEEELALIVPAGEDAGRGEAWVAAMNRLLAELKTVLGDAQLRLFAGRPAAGPETLHQSMAQARRARQVAEVCGLPEETVTYDRLGVYSLLYLIPIGEEREHFLQRYAVPLQLADRKGGGRLTETLDMFFRCNGNIKLTSEKLFAHYNTVVYRLDKIQHILGVSLDNPEDRLQLQLALKLGQIAGAHNR